MEFSNQSKVIILAVLVGVTVYLLTSNNSIAISNDGSLSQNRRVGLQNSQLEHAENVKSEHSKSDSESESELKSKKLKRSKNSSESEYKYSNYRNGSRGNSKKSALDDFFQSGVPQDQGDFGANDLDGGNYAAYSPGNKGKRMSDKDKFDPEALMPQEENDWFDDPYSGKQKKLKNKKLLNIYRPIAANTVGSTRKLSSYDIRGNEPCPKYTVSPWGNSSVEPDSNIRRHFGKN